MKQSLASLIVLFLFSACTHSTSVLSPDGKLAVTFHLTEQGQPVYSVQAEGKSVIDVSPLGLVAQELDLSEGFYLADCDRLSTDYTWETVWGEERLIRDNHNEMTVSLLHKSGLKMHIVFRCFDDGFAFRYVFPEQDVKQLTITDELTGYRFAGDPETWSLPWRTEYYEGLWSKAPLSAKSDTLCSPLTMECADGYAFLHEAALTDYPAQNL